MAILYFNAAVDNDWNTSGNWWLDGMFTTPGYVPSPSDDAVVTETCSSNSSGSTASVNTLTIQGGSMLGVAFSIPCNISVSCSVISGGTLGGDITGGSVILDASSAGSCTLDDGAGNAGHIIRNGGSANSCTFNGNLTIAQSIDTSNSFIENTTVNGNVIVNSNGQIGQTNGTNTINGNVTINGTGYFATGTFTTDVTGDVIAGSTASSSNTINSVGGDLIYTYGHLATFSISTLTGDTYYSDYPTLYYNNAATDNNWHNNLNWWVDSGYTQQAYEVPSSSQDVVIGGSIYDTTTDMYCNNATINNGLMVISSPTPTLNINSTITVSDNYYIGDGMAPGPDIICVNAIFNGNSYVTGNTDISASGTTTFNNTSKLGNSMSGGATITGDVEFKDSSEFISGTITGDVTVYYPNTAPFVYGGTITGTLSYSGYPARTVYFYHTSSSEDWGGNFWYSDSAHSTLTTPPNPDISLDNVIIEASVSSNTTYLNATVGTLTVNDVATPATFIGIDITCDYANFNDYSYLNSGAVLTQSVNHSGNSITFSDLSQNDGTINPDTPPVVFEDSASNDGTINGDVDVYYPSEKPVGGTVTGFITYYGWTLYFGGMSNDGNWSNTNNWFLDASNLTPYGNVPSETMPYQNVILQNSVTTASSFPSAYDISCGLNSNLYIDVNIYVYGLATFENNGYLDSGSTITGNALFKDTSTNRGGAITGTATFELTAAQSMINNGYDGTYGAIEFKYDKGINGSSILGVV